MATNVSAPGHGMSWCVVLNSYTGFRKVVLSMNAKVKRRVKRLYAKAMRGERIPAWLETSPDVFEFAPDLFRQIEREKPVKR